MFGVPNRLGHLTSSGTIANLEALWVARELRPGTTVVRRHRALHHARMCAVLGVAHEPIAADARGRMDLGALAARLLAGGVGTVVATLGTTSLGALDDVGAIAGLCAEHGARLHVDTAYGGFFALIADGADPGVAPGRSPRSRAPTPSSSIRTSTASSPTAAAACCSPIRPSGASTRTIPYTYFTSDDLHLGEISLECSRAGAAAAALWTTIRALPLTRDGLGQHQAASRAAALRLAERIHAADGVELVVEPELDIVCIEGRATPSPPSTRSPRTAGTSRRSASTTARPRCAAAC